MIINKCLKFIIAIALSLMFTVSLAKLILCIWNNDSLWMHAFGDSKVDVEEWLESIGLSEYKDLFHEKGKCDSFIIIYVTRCPQFYSQILLRCQLLFTNFNNF